MEWIKMDKYVITEWELKGLFITKNDAKAYHKSQRMPQKHASEEAWHKVTHLVWCYWHKVSE